MKKAKVMFTALAVLAVVGGALAFKSKTFAQYQLYTSTPEGCVLTSANLFFDPASPAVFLTSYPNGTITNEIPPAAACTTTTYFTNEVF